MSSSIQPSPGNFEALPTQVLRPLPHINAAATEPLNSLKESLVDLTPEQKNNELTPKTPMVKIR